MPKTIAYFRVFEIQFFAELRQLGKVKRYSFLFPKVPLKVSDPEDVLILRGIFLI